MYSFYLNRHSILNFFNILVPTIALMIEFIILSSLLYISRYHSLKIRKSNSVHKKNCGIKLPLMYII